MWYRAGTISVTNGSASVTGAGTAFVENVRSGYGIIGPDGRPYEVANVVSNTQLTLASTYQGATASGQSYAIFPTQSVIADLTTQVAAMISSFALVRDGIGQGLMPDGSQAAPGMRFANDQDTGFYRSAGGNIVFVNDGVALFSISPSGVSITGGTISGVMSRIVAVPAGGHTLALEDMGSLILQTSGATRSVTIPPNSSVPFPNSTTIELIATGGGSLSIQRGSGVTLNYAGANANRVLAGGNRALLYKQLTDTWAIVGAGIS